MAEALSAGGAVALSSAGFCYAKYSSEIEF
jgi:hypothetical protein